MTQATTPLPHRSRETLYYRQAAKNFLQHFVLFELLPEDSLPKASQFASAPELSVI